jgi:hypothetical protein
MFDIDRNLQVVFLVFIGSIFLFYQKKPSIMFKEDGKPKEFGSGGDKTIAPIWLISLMISILFYIQFTVKKDDFV